MLIPLKGFFIVKQHRFSITFFLIPTQIKKNALKIPKIIRKAMTNKTSILYKSCILLHHQLKSKSHLPNITVLCA